ncbi:hypothetical protein GCM10010401_07860 [Rarobacter faecitabidus]|uniref:Heat shock protein Hsp15 n=1 Tax=Rarobacter faecitabidus TaxID=13243 RepID=A0A542ZAN2_RARFA|nr:RNA-binding S4 domain-containing protein [Rarobacter faecitabidus]TQL57393.1 heat shock protein Hsp15 [Rarobacter faecitabidus]
MESQESARIDVWLWSVRLAKTRSAAASACKAGHVRVDGERTKPAAHVRPGARIEITGGALKRIVVVTKIINKRVGAPVATQCYEDHSPPPPPRELSIPVAVRERGAGRPTKRERRELDRLRGRDI